MFFSCVELVIKTLGDNMNGKETQILEVVANDIKWMKEKQVEHDHKLDKIDERLSKGTGKIAENRVNIIANEKKINDILKYGISVLVMVFGAIGSAIAWLFKR